MHVHIRLAGIVVCVLATFSCLHQAVAQAPASPKCTPEGCGQFGTSITWVTDFEQAQQQARQHSKLLFVVHLSGNFAKETFT